MKRQKQYTDTKYSTTKSKNATSSSSSHYSTCSDNHYEDNFGRENIRMSTQSTILAGQIPDYQIEKAITPEDSIVFQAQNEIINETNYSINILDQNLDVLSDDMFMDCEDTCKDDSSENNSTKYLELPFLDRPKIQSEHDRLITIVEETEVTHTSNSLLKNPSISIKNNNDSILMNMDNCLHSHSIVNNYNNNNCTRRVLFANEDNIIVDETKKSKRVDKFKCRKREHTSKPLVGRDGCKLMKENMDENCNNHNTTESFVLWEKLCNATEKINFRRSFSFSELNSVSDNYGADDEYSMSFKTLDDMYLPNYTIDSLNCNDRLKKRHLRYKSKSCESLLNEVKHLPHIMYDKFLKCLAEEIENMRKQNVICTCQKINRKHLNKENNEKKVQNIKNQKSLGRTDKKDIKSLLKVSPLKLQDRNRLSPEILKNTPQNNQRLSPKSPNKTPVTPTRKRELYCWKKEIVSPVGEYIKGKRPIPFKSSPSKRKV